MTEHGQGADDPGAPGPADTPWTASRQAPSVQQLESFLILAEELHFGRAAARLFVTQPALSRQLRSLEERLDVILLRRSRRHVEITPAGAALLPKARAVVEAMAGLCRAAGSHSRQIEGRLVIGSIGAEAAMPYTRAVLDELHACHPRLRTSVRGLDLATHFEALERGEVDVLFLRPPVPPGIETLTMATEPRVACLPADDPLAGRDEVTLTELSGRPVVDVPPECPRMWWRFWAADPRPDGSPVRYGPVVPIWRRCCSPSPGARPWPSSPPPPAVSSPGPASATSRCRTCPRAPRPWPGRQGTAPCPRSPPSAAPPRRYCGTRRRIREGGSVGADP